MLMIMLFWDFTYDLVPMHKNPLSLSSIRGEKNVFAGMSTSVLVVYSLRGRDAEFNPGMREEARGQDGTSLKSGHTSPAKAPLRFPQSCNSPTFLRDPHSAADWSLPLGHAPQRSNY